MKHRVPFYFSKTLRSFVFACNGLRSFLKAEYNARIHLFATFCVVIAMILVPLSNQELVILVIVTGLVWVGEMFNSAIEKIMDFISVEKTEKIRYIKDVSAGAVFILSVMAMICAFIIFIPKLL